MNWVAIHADTTLAIIAGGRATRLGGIPKGLLRRDGRPIVEHLAALGRDFGDVLLVANEPAPYAHLALRTVPDAVAGKGAPGGVHAALAGARTPWVAAVAADMPFASRAPFEVLLGERSAGAPLLCFEVRGRLEPLLGVYAAALEPRWRALLDEDPPFRRLFQELSGRVLPEARLREVDPALRCVESANSPGDVTRLGLAWPEGIERGGGSAR